MCSLPIPICFSAYTDCCLTEIDGREIPPDWNTGYLGINTTGPTQKPPLDYRTEVFQLNPALSNAAFALSRNVTLDDDAQA